MPTTALCATEIYRVGDLWFSTDPKQRAQAKTICRRCPLVTACAQASLDLGPDARGVWGGLSSGDRRVLRTGEHAADPDDEGDELPARRQEARPCGTAGAYTSHRARGEACVVCEEAHAVRVEAGRRERLAGSHGTDAGHRLHRQLGETPCGACHEAAIRKRAADRARRREEGRVAWERRQGAGDASEAVLGPSGAAA